MVSFVSAYVGLSYCRLQIVTVPLAEAVWPRVSHNRENEIRTELTTISPHLADACAVKTVDPFSFTSAAVQTTYIFARIAACKQSNYASLLQIVYVTGTYSKTRHYANA